MKIVLLIMFIFFAIPSNSQTTYNLSEYLNHINDTVQFKVKDFKGELNKFVGVWKWIDNNNPKTYFEIHLTKVEDIKRGRLRDSSQYTIDEIIGNYLYVKNGIIITNTLNNTNYIDLFPCDACPNMISTYLSPNKLWFSMKDLVKSKIGMPFFKIIDLETKPFRASWKIPPSNSSFGTELPLDFEGFSIPSEVILIKQTQQQ